MKKTLRQRFGEWLVKTVWVDSELRAGWDSTDWSTENFGSLSREGYEHVSTVFRCINLVAKTAANITTGVFEDTDEGPELVNDHPLPLQLRRPNHLQGRATFVKYWVTSMLLGGRAFIWANVLDSGEVAEFWVLPPTQVDVQLGTVFGTIDKITWNSTESIDLNPEHVLYTWFPNPRDFMQPISPLKAAAQEVDISTEGLRWNLSLLTNGAKPSLYVSLDPKSEMPLKDEHVKEVKKALAEEYSGSRRVGKSPVFKIPGMKLNDYGWNPHDMDWMKGLDQMDVRIANVFDVPPELVGAQKTYENFKEANRVLHEHATVPIMELFVDELTNWDLLLLEDNQFVGLLMDKIKAFQEDQDKTAKRVVSLVDSGVITRNEGRLDLKKPKSDDPMADVLTVSKPIETIGIADMNAGTEEV